MKLSVGALLLLVHGFENAFRVVQNAVSDYHILHKQVFVLLEVTDKDYQLQQQRDLQMFGCQKNQKLSLTISVYDKAINWRPLIFYQ